VANIDPALRKMNFDPEGQFSIAHYWGTTGYAYDTSKVKRELTSWKDILEPEKDIQGRIAMLADPREALSAAIRYKGVSANTKDAKAINDAKTLLIAQKKSVKAYQDSPDNAKLLAAGQVWVAQVYVGDAIQISREKPSIKYVIPADVSTVFVDNLCIPKGAKAKYTAEVFMNYFMDPKNAAANANDSGFPSPNQAAIKAGLIDKDLLSNPAVYPDLAKMAKNLELLEQQDEATETLFDKAWTEIGVK
jgi:spermidine/putrescine transport system substrate-binding protein